MTAMLVSTVASDSTTAIRARIGPGQPTSVPPERLEPVGRQVRVAGRVCDVLVAEVVLNRSRVLPVVGQFVAGRVSQHVG
jgi:hypothetical protein